MTSNKVALGSLVMVSKRFVVRVLSLISTFVLARLLAPADFGLLTLILSFSAILEAFTEFKFDRVLVRTEQVDSSHYSTAFTLNVISNTLVAVILIALTPWVAHLAKADDAALVLQAVALCTFIDGFMNMGMIEWRRKVDFSREFRLDFLRKLLEISVSIAWAVHSPSVWALVAGMFAGRVMGLVLSYALHPLRPRFTLLHWRMMLSFSTMSVGYSLATRIATRADTFIISRLFSLEAVGLYSNAQLAATLPTAELARPIGIALFSGYSTLVKDIPRLRAAYLRALHGVLFICLPAAVGMSFVADAIVTLLLGPKWFGCVELLQTLALVQTISLSGASSWSVLVALDRMKGLLIRASVMMVVRPVVVYLVLANYGFSALPYAILIAIALQVSADNWSVRRALRLQFKSWLLSTWSPYFACAAMSAALWFALPAGNAITVSAAFAKVGLAVGIGAPVYAAVIFLLWRLSGKPDGVERMLLEWLRKRLPGART